MTKKEIGAAIKARRKNKGVTGYAVANETPVQHAQLKNIESGESNYTIDSLLAVTDFIGLDLRLVVPANKK